MPSRLLGWNECSQLHLKYRINLRKKNNLPTVTKDHSYSFYTCYLSRADSVLEINQHCKKNLLPCFSGLRGISIRSDTPFKNMLYLRLKMASCLWGKQLSWSPLGLPHDRIFPIETNVKIQTSFKNLRARSPSKILRNSSRKKLKFRVWSRCLQLN